MQVGGSGIGTDTLRLDKIDGPFKKKPIGNLPVTSSKSRSSESPLHCTKWSAEKQVFSSVPCTSNVRQFI